MTTHTSFGADCILLRGFRLARLPCGFREFFECFFVIICPLNVCSVLAANECPVGGQKSVFEQQQQNRGGSGSNLTGQ